jgi:hypothetical protein
MFAVSMLLPPNFCAAQPAHDTFSLGSTEAWAVESGGSRLGLTCWDLGQHIARREGAEQDRHLTL